MLDVGPKLSCISMRRNAELFHELYCMILIFGDFWCVCVM